MHKSKSMIIYPNIPHFYTGEAMRRIYIIAANKKHARLLIFVTAAFLLAGAFSVAVLFPRAAPVYDGMDEQEITALEKENSKLRQILKSIVPENDQALYEDPYRNRFVNAQGYSPPVFETFPLPEVLKKGEDVHYSLLADKPGYLRPLYDPGWKDAFYRGWLYLPEKNINARHRLFIYPFGGSSIYDFTGTLGMEDGTTVDYHRNINLLIYGFTVENVKYYKNQVALVGEPLRKGCQIISIVQNDLLPDGIDTRDILLQLATPQGYEVDFAYGNVIRYEYLTKQIKENTVIAANSDESRNGSLEQLINENLSLKKELSFFVPMDDKVITQEKCKPVPPNFPLDPALKTMRLKGQEIAVNKLFKDNTYMRPLYNPAWYKNYRKRWCFIPRQVCYSQHRLFLIPQNAEEQADLFGILGFQESFSPLKDKEYGYLAYNFQISKAVIYEDQILLIGTPSRNGAEIITIDCSGIPRDQLYFVRMITPDDQELDYVIMG